MPDGQKLSLQVLSPKGAPVATLRVRDIDLGADSELAIDGTVPVSLVVDEGVKILGRVVVNAGANPTACKDAGASGKKGTSIKRTDRGAGGGGGGGRAMAGGKGGNGYGPIEGGDGGKALSGRLFGGCPGGAGGDNTAVTQNQGGSAGRGGGAISIYARKNIEIAGQIMANGTGGGGGTRRGGGGGGGAGGTIYLDGQEIRLHRPPTGGTPLCANGGGGGEGGYQDGKGGNGADGGCVTSRAPGGAKSTSSGNGGLGGALLVIAGTAGGNGRSISGVEGGGGGGGGSAGRIWIRARTSLVFEDNTQVSPAHIPVP